MTTPKLVWMMHPCFFLFGGEVSWLLGGSWPKYICTFKKTYFSHRLKMEVCQGKSRILIKILYGESNGECKKKMATFQREKNPSEVTNCMKFGLRFREFAREFFDTKDGFGWQTWQVLGIHNHMGFLSSDMNREENDLAIFVPIHCFRFLHISTSLFRKKTDYCFFPFQKQIIETNVRNKTYQNVGHFMRNSGRHC